MVGLFYGSSFHVKCLVQSGLAATAPLFHHSPTHTSGSPHGSESSGNYSSSYQETLMVDFVHQKLIFFLTVTFNVCCPDTITTFATTTINSLQPVFKMCLVHYTSFLNRP